MSNAEKAANFAENLEEIYKDYNQLESTIMDFKWITIDLISLKTMEINEL